jgi:hypothetical protein
MTGHEVSDWGLTDDEVMALSRAVLGWADRVFAAYPPIRSGRVLDWCQELVDLRDEVDRLILWRAITSSSGAEATDAPKLCRGWLGSSRSTKHQIRGPARRFRHSATISSVSFAKALLLP